YRGHVVGVFPRLRLPAAIEIDGRFAGSDADAADRDGRLAGHLDEDRNFAADSEPGLFGNGCGEDTRDTGADGVAALCEDAETGLDLEVVSCANHFMSASHRGEHRGARLRGECGRNDGEGQPALQRASSE